MHKVKVALAVVQEVRRMTDTWAVAGLCESLAGSVLGTRGVGDTVQISFTRFRLDKIQSFAFKFEFWPK